MSAKMRSRVTAERRLRAARTMLPLFNEEHGSSANSLAAMLIASPEMAHKGYHSVQTLYIYIYIHTHTYIHIYIHTKRKPGAVHQAPHTCMHMLIHAHCSLYLPT